MRSRVLASTIPLRHLLAALIFAGVALSEGPAGAYSIRHEARGPTTALHASDTVTIDVFLEPNCVPFACETFGSLAVAVLFDPAQVTYDTAATRALSNQGGQPSYILYQIHSPLLYPTTQQRYWPLWPDPPAGLAQVNIDFFFGEGRNALDDTVEGFGVDVWLGAFVFHVNEDAMDSLIELSMTADGAGISTYRDGPLLDPSSIALSAPIAILVPEPGTLLLWVAGGLAWLLLRR